MDGKKLFKHYYNRLAREGMLKALLLGAIAGFAVNFVVAFATWFVNGFNGLWVSIAAGVAVLLVSTPVFYFKFYRPSAKKIARRIDRLGLEERLITMTELENDESYIAMRQREDAREKLDAFNGKKIHFHFSRAAIVIVAVFGVLGISMTTVNALSAHGIAPSGNDVIDHLTPPPSIDEYYSISYLVEGGGHIESADGGEDDQIEQLVLPGEDGAPVVAVADDGWVFQNWDDDLAEPQRQELNVHEDLVFTAVFVEMEEGDGDGDGEPQEGDESGEGDQAQDAPSADGSPNDSEGDPQDSPQESDPNGNPNSGASGRYEDNNKVIDKNTYYRDVYEEYYERAMEKLENGDDLTDEERAIIESYFDTIK